jgi:hypothetical protein
MFPLRYKLPIQPLFTWNGCPWCVLNPDHRSTFQVTDQIGVILATAYMFMSERKVSAKDEAIPLTVALTHFLLEVPSHREGEV